MSFVKNIDCVSVKHGDTNIKKIMKGDDLLWPALKIYTWIKQPKVTTQDGDKTPYILSGYIPNMNTAIKVHFSGERTDGQWTLLGARVSANDRAIHFFFPSNASTKISRLNFSDKQATTTASSMVDQGGYYAYVSKTEYYITKDGGTNIIRGTWSPKSVTFTHPITIFGLNNNGSIESGGSTDLTKCPKVYYIRFYENGTLVRNFVPATYYGEAGMWDLVQKKFYKNDGPEGTYFVVGD